MDLQEIPRAEALDLLASVPFGRLVFTRRALPAVHPVNFVVDGDSVVLRLTTDGAAGSSVHGAVVALQADEVDALWHTGWSVTVTGEASEVSDPTEVQRLGSSLRPWAPGEHERFVRIPAAVVTGRRLTAGSSSSPPGERGAGER